MEVRIVNIYESVDTLRRPGTEEVTPRRIPANQRVDHCPTERRSFRCSAVCLGLLCALLLAGIIGLGLYHIIVTNENIRERELKNARYRNTSEVVQDKISFMKNLNEVIQEKNNLVKNLTEVIQEKNNLVKNLTEERDELLMKNKMGCRQGWQKFGCSCYNLSVLQKIWNESRQDCIERGADLVIINSKEELDFVNGFKKLFWVGLTDIEVEGKWKWVDGSPLSDEHKFWGNSEPNGEIEENCVEQVFSPNEPFWNDLPCFSANHKRFWVCERATAR